MSVTICHFLTGYDINIFMVFSQNTTYLLYRKNKGSGKNIHTSVIEQYLWYSDMCQFIRTRGTAGRRVEGVEKVNVEQDDRIAVDEG